MSCKALFERLGDKLYQSHPSQGCLGFDPSEERIWQINRCTHESIFAYLSQRAKYDHFKAGEPTK
jgi:hypothetical protein